MKDGAHTHHDHSGGSGIWLAVVIGLVLVASSGAIASALAELVRLLVIVLAVTAGLAITTGLVVMIRRRPRRQRPRIAARASILVPSPDQSRPEIAVLRAELASLRRQVATLTAPADLSSLDGLLPEADPLALEAGRPGRDDS